MKRKGNEWGRSGEQLGYFLCNGKIMCGNFLHEPVFITVANHLASIDREVAIKEAHMVPGVSTEHIWYTPENEEISSGEITNRYCHTFRKPAVSWLQ